MATSALKLIAIALTFIAVTKSAEVESEEKEKSTETRDISGLVVGDEVRNGSNSINPFEYSVRMTMVNYGQTSAKVHQRFLFPDGAEVKSFFLGDPNENSRTKRSAENQRLTQWDGGSVNLDVGKEKDADMVYINHPTQVFDINSKTFHRLSTSLTVTEGDVVGGEIFSPNFPISYPDGADLTWLIAYPENNVIRLEMVDFSMEECCDHLIIYDGFNKSQAVLATFDGDYYPSPDNVVLSTRPAMFLRFTSDCLGTRRGFQATYINEERMPATMSCGQIQYNSGNSGTIYSPNYPGTYDPNMNCTWQVQTYYNTRIKFDLTDFSLSYDDYLVIYDGTPSNPGSQIIQLVGSSFSSYTIYANSNRAFVVFTSGYSTNYYNKFVISYTGIDNTPETTTSRVESTTWSSGSGDGCFHQMPYNYGTIYSPNYPGNYYDYLDCTWTVQVSSYKDILFTFNYFDTESCCDHVYIYEGTPQSSRGFVAEYSGYQTGLQVHVRDYQAYITMNTDYSVTERGFSISYAPVDATRSNSQESQIQSAALDPKRMRQSGKKILEKKPGKGGKKPRQRKMGKENYPFLNEKGKKEKIN